MDGRHWFSSIPQGRYLDLILALDEIDPGFAGWLMRLPNKRQQIIYAVLIKAACDLLSLRLSPENRVALVRSQRERLRTLTLAMRSCRPRDLIETHYHSCPDGLLGAYEKTSGGPQDGGYYLRLHIIFAQASNKPLILVIRQLQSLDLQQLNILTALDPIFLVPRFVAKVATPQQAHDLTAALTLIRQVVGEEANDDALRASITSIGEKITLSEWVTCWLYRTGRIPGPPLALGPDWIALTSGRMITDAGRRYRNCLRIPRQMIRALRGQAQFFENRRLNLIAEVKAIGPERTLVLEGVHGPGNMHVFPTLRQQVRADFMAVGVPHEHWRPADCPWEPVARLTYDVSLFGLRDGGGDERPEEPRRRSLARLTQEPA
jgi:hypothetical protein